jgi:hypothetical protein
MDVSQSHAVLGAGRKARRLALLIALAIALLTSIWMAAGPVSNANAGVGQFCWGAGVGPWGHCTSNWGQWLTSVHGKGGQHSGCVNAYHNGALVSSWACSPTNTWAFIGYNGARWMHGTVRNNTASNNVLYGEMWYP